MRTFPVLARLSRPFGGSKRTVPLAPERRQGLTGRSRRSVPHASRSAPMARRMLIDASHPEETRVVVVDGTKLSEFDFETASRKALKGNIYLAKVIRIEPSLQAAFVEYGGNRHGFLAFSEIHPDYYQIPVADRERLIAEQRRLQAEAEDEPEPQPDKVDRTDILEAREDAAAEKAAAIGEATPPAIDEPAVTETAEAPPAEA